MNDLTEKTLNTERKYTGKIINVDLLDIELPDGRKAKRETSEETGYEVTSIRFLTTTICTPGYCEERIHTYFAELSETAHGQDQDPDENVFPVILSETEVEDGIRNGTIFDAKTLSACAWSCAAWARS